MTPTQKAHRQGTFYMLLVIAIWGGFLPVGKSALQAVDPYWLTALRFGTAALVFLGLLAWREGATSSAPKATRGRSLFFGACGFAGFGICLFEGLKLTRPEISAMILATRPDPGCAVPVVAQQAPAGQLHPGDDRPGGGRRTAGGHLGQLARLVGGDALGNGLVFLASLFWTAYTLGGQQFPGWSPVRYTALSCSLGCLAIAAALLPPPLPATAGRPARRRWPRVWPQLAFIVFCVSCSASCSGTWAWPSSGPLSAGLFANFTPVITYLIAIAQGRRPRRRRTGRRPDRARRPDRQQPPPGRQGKARRHHLGS
jgi:drug/metabolite transporter (DMT)-like permease